MRVIFDGEQETKTKKRLRAMAILCRLNNYFPDELKKSKIKGAIQRDDDLHTLHSYSLVQIHGV